MAFGDLFGINTYAFSQSMTGADCLRFLADRGVAQVEQMFFPGHFWVSDTIGQIQDYQSVLAQTGIGLTSVNTSNVELNITAASEEMRAASLGLNERFIEIAGEIGAGALILGPGKANPLFPLPRELLEGHFFRSLDRLLPVAEKNGVEIFLENMPFAFIPDAEGLMDILKAYGDDRLKICYDVANAHFIGEDPAAGLQTVSPRLGLLHLSDTTASLYRHDPVGEGDIDFHRLPGALKDAGYEQACILEIICPEPETEIAKSVAALRAVGF
ncbi:sugar phosphate isomerase/epimerase family protein [Roseibium aggregatum]|uniref:Sugar phosphate isomerase/epimerase n=1 Tax=Roseibium aggregatum TaxID=187304 RepID=A0A939EHA8_9HYPH|nr:sugar phosphate isomerase/epimerase family protein [Roseibium aggregatum]MBN9671529.1 sugar phosphate isomerase/epimerase [Roseibium aggregatum]